MLSVQREDLLPQEFVKLWYTKLDRENRFQTSRVQNKPKPKQNKQWEFRVSAVSDSPRPSHGDTHTLFELAGLEPTFTLGHSRSKNDSTNLDTCKNKLLRGKNLRLVSCSLVLVWNNLQRAKNLKTTNYQRKMATPSQLFVTEWDEID